MSERAWTDVPLPFREPEPRYVLTPLALDGLAPAPLRSSTVGRALGLSPTAMGRWCRVLGLPAVGSGHVQYLAEREAVGIAAAVPYGRGALATLIARAIATTGAPWLVVALDSPRLDLVLQASTAEEALAWVRRVPVATVLDVDRLADRLAQRVASVSTPLTPRRNHHE